MLCTLIRLLPSSVITRFLLLRSDADTSKVARTESVPRFGTNSEIGEADRNDRTLSATNFACNLFRNWSVEKGFPKAEHDLIAVPADSLPERLSLFALQAGYLCVRDAVQLCDCCCRLAVQSNGTAIVKHQGMLLRMT